MSNVSFKHYLPKFKYQLYHNYLHAYYKRTFGIYLHIVMRRGKFDFPSSAWAEAINCMYKAHRYIVSPVLHIGFVTWTAFDIAQAV